MAIKLIPAGLDIAALFAICYIYPRLNFFDIKTALILSPGRWAQLGPPYIVHRLFCAIFDKETKISMNAEKIKEYLRQIAENVTPQTQLEDIYEHLALLADIDESEDQEKKGDILTQDQVEDKSKEWLK